jgi:FMN phosphatase YigB (HAD superfamily)
MTVVFDLDNTLVDSFGSSVRPGIVGLLARLQSEGHTLVLWTNSRRDRAEEILRLHGLRRFFSHCIFREDYDPDEQDVPKDIRRIRGDFLVEDDPKAAAYARATGKRTFVVRPFRKGMTVDRKELSDLYAAISRPRGFLARLLS